MLAKGGLTFLSAFAPIRMYRLAPGVFVVLAAATVDTGLVECTDEVEGVEGPEDAESSKEG